MTAATLGRLGIFESPSTSTRPRSNDERLVGRMNGFDAGFLYLEEPDSPMNTLKIFELRVPIGRRASASEVFDAARRIAARLPPLRWRAEAVPGNLHHPLWIEQPYIEPRDHIGWALAVPRTERERDAIIADVARQPLPRDRPLWHATLIEHADPERLTVVIRLHHAVADGLASARMLTRLSDLWTCRTTRPNRALAQLPGAFSRVASALVARAGTLLTVPGLLARTIRGAWRARAERKALGSGSGLKSIFDAPPTSLNVDLDHRRAFRRTSFDFAVIRRISKAHGCTVGDVLLTLVGGGLRRHFERRGERLPKHMTAGVPMGLDAEDDDRISGNRVSHYAVDLRTDLIDPLERLEAVAAANSATKRVHRGFGPRLLLRWSSLSIPAVLRAIWRLQRRFTSPAINLIVSNVPGPRDQLSIGGVRLVSLYSVGPVLDRIGLNVTAWTYAGRMNVSVLANGKSTLNLEPFVQGMIDALDLLHRRANDELAEGIAEAAE